MQDLLRRAPAYDRRLCWGDPIAAAAWQDRSTGKLVLYGYGSDPTCICLPDRTAPDPRQAALPIYRDTDYEYLEAWMARDLIIEAA